MKKAGIIGGSGFIGSYVTKIFLDHGFAVRASATDISNEAKYTHLMSLPHSDNLHIAELNVLDKEALRDFVQDCDIIIHGGTPFQLEVDDPTRDLYDPTIAGTENLLSIVRDTPSVEKVVIIASVAAFNTNFPMPAGGKTANDAFNESDKKFIADESIPYSRAKFIANQAVEKFIRENDDLHFEITSVSPVVVMGKPLSNRADSTSVGIQYFFKNRIAPDDFFQMLYDTDAEFAVVDVSDVAEAIFRAATTKGLHGRNYLLSSQTFATSDLSRMLNFENARSDGKIIYENALAVKDLGISFRPVKETLTSYSRS